MSSTAVTIKKQSIKNNTAKKEDCLLTSTTIHLDKKTRQILNLRMKDATPRLEEKKQLEIELVSTSEINKDKHHIETHSKYQTSVQFAESKKKHITKQEQMGLFESFPINKNNVCPTLLSRLPIFAATDSMDQRKQLNGDMGWEFDTPFGSGTRYGAILDSFDKRVFHALCRLREKRLRGERKALPIPISNIFKISKNGNVDVDVVICTTTEILNEIGLSDGGSNYVMVRDVIKRINRTVIELRTTNNRYTEGMEKGERGFSFKLIDAQWLINEEKKGIFYIQFTPITTKWLAEEFTFIDWETRKKIGKHRIALGVYDFLSSQPKSTHWKMIDLANTIGLRKAPKFIKVDLIRACDHLISIGWLKGYKFKGTGRKTPLELFTWQA